METRKDGNKKGEKAMTLKNSVVEQLIGDRDAGNITEEYYNAAIKECDVWVPACGGNEDWTLARSGRSYLYVYNPATGEHGWLNESDIVEMESPYGV